MKTVHIVFNAHIDPIWLWPWNSGIDTLLATCRSACDRLDKHNDLQFVRGEAWVYREIERIDPELFERIRGHAQGGRWHIVGGWWIQPDCNGPSGFGFEKQIELGKEYFLEKFGTFPRIGYNVDSFGHAATLPGIMRQFGQDRYVFMRPQEWEMELPARVFRWRGYEGGPEVMTFRIAKAYTCRGVTREHIEAALSCLPEGVDHTMSFVGFGDHGGGPTEAQIAWVRENQNAFEGAKLVFSSPQAFFDVIERECKDKLPLVTGELQHHSIGCYSVHRPVKVGVRHAEHRLIQAETLVKSEELTRGAGVSPAKNSGQNMTGGRDVRSPEAGGQDARPPVKERLKEAWRWVCFGHFHDTFGGTCIPSAYEQVHAQLGYAFAEADEIIQHSFRRQIVKNLPDDKLQRIVLFNASDQAYEGYAIHEPWLEAEHWKPHWRLINDQGEHIPHQRMHAEALVPDDYLYFLRLLFKVKLAPGEMKTLRIDPHGVEEKDLSGHERVANSKVKPTTVSLANNVGVSLQISGNREIVFPPEVGEGERGGGGDTRVALPRIEMVEDPTDTWTHEVDRYDDVVIAAPEWKEVRAVDFGPLMASLQQRGQIHHSELLAEWRVYADEPFTELLLRVYWSERHKQLKLTVPLSSPLKRRWDGIAGGELERSTDGKERPVRDRTLLELQDGTRVGLVFPDAYALDASNKARGASQGFGRRGSADENAGCDVESAKVRITLLRSPLMAHHYPFQGGGPRGLYADQGVHEFRFRFFAGPGVTGDLLDRHALMMQRPLIAADWTRGMPAQ